MQQKDEALVRRLASGSTVWERLKKDTLALQLKCHNNEKELSLSEELLLIQEFEEVPETCHGAYARHVDVLEATFDVGRPLRREGKGTRTRTRVEQECHGAALGRLALTCLNAGNRLVGFGKAALRWKGAGWLVQVCPRIIALCKTSR